MTTQRNPLLQAGPSEAIQRATDMLAYVEHSVCSWIEEGTSEQAAAGLAWIVATVREALEEAAQQIPRAHPEAAPRAEPAPAEPRPAPEMSTQARAILGDLLAQMGRDGIGGRPE